ncbi:MAG: efflux RND transporter periplasmic adaptor subunit [Saprospirales bacterium]|nr:efflux RND transporter periplasmic adaptor subunit [Saprospirales bacterium]
MKNMLFGVFSLCLFIGMSACSQDSPASDESTDPPTGKEGIHLSVQQMELAGIEVGQATRRIMHNYLECTGQIEVPPQNRASIHSPIHGFIQEVRFLEGDLVRKGTILAVLSHPDLIRLQREMLESKGRLTWLKQEMQRIDTLAADDAIARKEQGKARSDYQIEKAHFEGIKAELSLIGLPVETIEQGEIQQNLFLKAPVSGYITGIHAHLGNWWNRVNPFTKWSIPGMSTWNYRSLPKTLAQFDKARRSNVGCRASNSATLPKCIWLEGRLTRKPKPCVSMAILKKNPAICSQVLMCRAK